MKNAVCALWLLCGIAGWKLVIAETGGKPKTYDYAMLPVNAALGPVALVIANLPIR